MKIQIKKALVEGFQVLKTNPVIFLPLLFAAIVSYFINPYLADLTTEAIALMNYFSGEEIDFGLILSALPIGKIFLALFIGGIVSFYFFLATVKLTYDSFLKKPSVGEAFKSALKRFIPVILAGTLIFLLNLSIGFAAIMLAAVIWALNLPIAVGTMLVLIIALGGFILIVYLQIKFIYYVYAGVIDEKGIIDSLKTSWKLTFGNFWQTLALALITMFVALLLAPLVAPLPKGVATVIGAAIQILTNGWAICVFTSAYLQIRSK
jgi:hypothetical protein